MEKSFDNWTSIEDISESTRMSCMLSKHPYLLIFMQYIFIRLTRLLYGVFSLFNEEKNHLIIHTEAINVIINKYKPMYDRNYLLRPGLDNMSTEDIFKMIDNIVKTGCDSVYISKFSLNQLMGAVYGISTDRVIIGKILLASTFKEFRKIFVGDDLNYESINHVSETITSIFGLPKDFNKHKLLQTIGYPSSDNPLLIMLLDMMVYNFHGKSISIVRRNLNNLPYIRVRSDKQQTEYIQSSNLPFCPTFHKKHRDDLKIVHGNSWYYVPNGSIMRKIMKLYGRRVKAGISGSTLMWMNLCFHVLGIKETRENLELLLLCIISDFVPKYHSLAEIILVYSKESKFATKHSYFVDEIPIKWLIDELQMNRVNIIDKKDFLENFNNFISVTYEDGITKLNNDKCIKNNIKIDSAFPIITRSKWDKFFTNYIPNEKNLNKV